MQKDPKVIDGTQIAEAVERELKDKILQLKTKPCLAVVIVGNDNASLVYVNMKTKSCEKLGIQSKKFDLPEKITEKEVLNLVDKLNNDSVVNGILVQLPLPKHIDETKIIQKISPLKDVDGFHPLNTGWMYQGKPGFLPCTPKGIIKMLEYCNVELEGKHAVVVGRSNIVGKPVANLLLEQNATATICHSKTKSLKDYTLQADILVAAVGIPKLITEDMVKEGVVVIDVGMNRVEDDTEEKGYRLCGDVDFRKVKEKASLITPVPGGVGKMTVAMLMQNTYEAYLLQNE